MRSERLIGSEHLSGGDAKQKGVTDVPSSAGHSYFNRSFHGGLAINVSLSKAKANYMSCRAKSRHPVKVPIRFATGFLDFARNDTLKISGRFWMRCIQEN